MLLMNQLQENIYILLKLVRMHIVTLFCTFEFSLFVSFSNKLFLFNLQRNRDSNRHMEALIMEWYVLNKVYKTDEI